MSLFVFYPFSIHVGPSMTCSALFFESLFELAQSRFLFVFVDVGILSLLHWKFSKQKEPSADGTSGSRKGRYIASVGLFRGPISSDFSVQMRSPCPTPAHVKSLDQWNRAHVELLKMFTATMFPSNLAKDITAFKIYCWRGQPVNEHSFDITPVLKGFALAPSQLSNRF